MNAPRYEVEIVHPVDGKPTLWDTYADRAKAESIAATLRKYGICCQVRRVDDEPEYRDDRRKFLIAVFMIGAVKPERVVERIVGEVELEVETLS